MQHSFPPLVSVTGYCHQDSPDFCQKDTSEPQPLHERGQGRGFSCNSSPGLGSAMSIQVGQERPIPSEGHCVWGGTLTHTLLPVIDSLSFVTLPCPVIHPTPSPVTLPLLALGCISGFCHCVSIILIGVTHCAAC